MQLEDIGHTKHKGLISGKIRQESVSMGEDVVRSVHRSC